MALVETNPAQPQVLDIKLPIGAIRKIVELQMGEAFRMTLTAGEVERMHSQNLHDWTLHQLKDGRYAVWKPKADIPSGPLGQLIVNRIITDDVE